MRDGNFFQILSEVFLDFEPSQIFFRENESKEILKIIERNFGCLLIIGDTGTGKTATLKNIIKKFPGKTIYCSIQEKSTTLKAFNSILKTNFKSLADLENSAKKPQFFANLNLEQRPTFIFDELHHVRDLREFFSFSESFYRWTKNSCILSTNKRNVAAIIESDVRLSSRPPIRLNFDRYDALQLKEILNQRIEILKQKGIEIDLEGHELPRIAALCTDEGSARKALYYLYCGISEKRFDEDFFQSLNKKETLFNIEDDLKKLPKNYIQFLKNLYDIYQKKESHALRQIKNKNCGEQQQTLDGKIHVGSELKKIIDSIEKTNKEISEFNQTLLDPTLIKILPSEIREVFPEITPNNLTNIITYFEKSWDLIERAEEPINRGRGGGRVFEISFKDKDLKDKIEQILFD